MKLHRHKWVATGVKHFREMWGCLVADYSTEVLYICSECNKAKTKTLSGTWTLREVKGGK